MITEFLKPAPPDYKWPRCPEADQFIEKALQTFLSRHAFAKRLAERLKVETSTLFSVWVDHVLLPARAIFLGEDLKRLGFWEDKTAKHPAGHKVFYHPYADLPRLVVSPARRKLDAPSWSTTFGNFRWRISLSQEITGAPYSSYRFMPLAEGPAELYIVERRGSLNFVPDKRSRAETYLHCFEECAARPRKFDSDTEGMKKTLSLARRDRESRWNGPGRHTFS